MTTRTTTVYSLVKPHSLLRELPFLITANLLLVVCGWVAFSLPFSPVPVTLQTFGVTLVAMALGRVRGTAVVAAYLIEGGMGMPVFAGGAGGWPYFLGPTGGYLCGFLAAAWVVGYLADRGWERNYLLSASAMTVGHAIIFAIGLVGLARFAPSGSLLTLGLYPFAAGTLLKIAAAAVLLPTVWRFAGRTR